jgi:hypothetical protein
MRDRNAFCETRGAWHYGRDILCSRRLWLFYECIIFETHPKHVSVRHVYQALLYQLIFLLLGMKVSYFNSTHSFPAVMDFLGSVHGSQGYMVIFLSLALTMIDGLAILRRIVIFFQNGDKLSIKAFWKVAILGRGGDTLGHASEYVGLVSEETEAFDKNEIALSPARDSIELDVRRQDFDVDTARWANDVRHQHYRRQSTISDGTLYGSPTSTRSVDKIQDAKGNFTSKIGVLRKIGNGIFAVLERVLVFAALGQLLTGIVVYTGMYIYLIMIIIFSNITVRGV